MGYFHESLLTPMYSTGRASQTHKKVLEATEGLRDRHKTPQFPWPQNDVKPVG